MFNVCVVGAGVVGLSTAACLQERFGPSVRVTIVADRFLSDTTSNGAAGIFLPHATDGTAEDVTRWSGHSFARYTRLLTSAEGVDAGVRRLCLYLFDNHYDTLTSLKQHGVFFGQRSLSDKELDTFPAYAGSDLKEALCISTLIVEPGSYLPYLTRQFRQRGGQILNRKLSTLRDLAGSGYDLIINCCGLGAAELCGDTLMYPVRGVTVRVNAPWIKHAILHKGIGYVIPTTHDVVLGGVYGVDQWHTEVSESDVEQVFAACDRLIPGVSRAARTGQVRACWAGLRPYRRQSVRVEVEQVERSGMPPVIHNYGHGANGIALSWGTAVQACDLAEQFIQKQHDPPTAKL